MGDVEQQVRDCKKQINALPRAVSSEPCSFVNAILIDFCDGMKALMRGSPLCAELVHSNKKLYREFKHQISQTAPSFIPFESTSPYRRTSASGIARQWVLSGDEPCT